jgi:CDP-diacylglycerol--glycerol-3-phosphate 3-phosphatidyltransferase
MYRVIAAPFLLLLLYYGLYDIFKWLLLLSFFTDFIDGYLARKFKVASILGTKLDSIGDDLTVMVAMIGLWVKKPEFIQQHLVIFLSLFFLFIIQVTYALIRYGKMTNFHTYLAKLAALTQGVFLLLVFFMKEPPILLFYFAVVITFLELIEEIILVWLLRKWEINIKGLYWVIKKQKISRQ